MPEHKHCCNHHKYREHEYVQAIHCASCKKKKDCRHGPTGPQGERGPQGNRGIQGLRGLKGATGPAGANLDFATFFALMPGDNSATVAVGADVQFPQNGPTNGSGLIVRTGLSTYNLGLIGTYKVSAQVSVSQAGQLLVTINGADLTYTVSGRATGTSQIVILTIIQTSVINSILTIRNPAGNSTALTITPFAGGNRPVSASLSIERLK